MPRKTKLYIETSVVSYLTARPSTDPLRSARQDMTRAWWATRSSYRLFSSQFVLDEARLGNPEAAARRLSALGETAVLRLTPEAWVLAFDLLARGGLPSTAYTDAAHVALAAVHGLDRLLTWNCSHIANPTRSSKIQAACEARGFTLPILCTPAEMMEE